MLTDRENILSAIREKPLKAYEIMKRAGKLRDPPTTEFLSHVVRK